MDLVPNLQSGWSFNLIGDNILLLSFVALVIGTVISVFTADNALSKVARVGLVLIIIAMVALLSGWLAGVFWLVILWIGFVLAVIAGIARGIVRMKA